MNRCLFLIMILGLFPGRLWAQTGGESTFAFLKIPTSPLSTAMGDAGISYHPNLGIALENPSLLSPNLDKVFEISYQKYVTDIRYTQLGYAQQLNHKIILAIDFAYMDYGKFVGTDDLGELTGNFSASEYKCGMHGAYFFNSTWSVGASLNLLYGQYEIYKAYAFGTNWAVSYQDAERGFKTSFAIKNLGAMLYSDANNGDQLPCELEWSFVKKLEKAPFAFSLALNDLQNWNIYHSTENQGDQLFDETTSESKWSKAGKEFISHIAVGVELRPSEVFCIMGGYNFKRQNQLSVDAQGEMVGFSMGVGVRIRNIQLQYAWAPMHIAGSVHHVGLSFCLKK